MLTLMCSFSKRCLIAETLYPWRLSATTRLLASLSNCGIPRLEIFFTDNAYINHLCKVIPKVVEVDGAASGY